ncbi:hypothetical protein [Sphingobacterium detergens]|uniref:hypothetical protein n=1 Tax=Sphingobacterium detergens TaxID=1145106 RepID=UPI003AAFA1FB
MAKYFYDTEFLEGEQTRYSWFGFKVSTWYKFIGLTLIGFGAFMVGLIGCKDPDALMCFATCLFASVFFFTLNHDRIPPTIDLISSGIVADDGREYYAISKEFNLREAWNRKWIRENVLKPLWRDLFIKDNSFGNANNYWGWFETAEINNENELFSFRSLKYLINKYGKFNKEIAQEIIDFCNPITDVEDDKIELYGYYADYDHVVFCWLFGSMINLPEGFPKFTYDLKQMINSHFSYEPDMIDYITEVERINGKYPSKYLVEYVFSNVEELKNHKDYPKQENEHLAISDARWNRDLYFFLEER